MRSHHEQNRSLQIKREPVGAAGEEQLCNIECNIGSWVLILMTVVSSKINRWMSLLHAKCTAQKTLDLQ